MRSFKAGEVKAMKNENQKDEKQEVDALCPECGHAFKTYVDRVIGGEPESELKKEIACPVCGCGECDIIKPGT
jgi:C4-type Zn-finger protein